MFGLSGVQNLSPDGAALKRLITRKPISIFSQIKNVKDEEKKEKLTQLLETLKKNLPEGFKIGAAVSAGDCFFDSVAQGLNELKDKGLIASDEGFNVQSLRRGYKEYAQRELSASKDLWLDKLLDKESEKLPEYIPRIEFTAEDIKNASSGSAVGALNLQDAIWSRPYTEGRILCNEYKVNLCYMEVQDDLIIENGKFYLRLEEDGKTKRGEEVSDVILKNVIKADSENTEQKAIHILNYKQHFVPLLKDIEKDIEEYIEVSRTEVYGLGSHSFIEDTGNHDLEEQKPQVQVQLNQDSFTATDVYSRLKEVKFDSNDSDNPGVWAGMDQINSYINNQAIKTSANGDELAYYIGPNNFGFDSKEGIEDIAKHICRKEGISNSFYGNKKSLDKPFIVISNTATVLAQSSTDVNQQGGTHWISWVLLPKKYVSLSGKEINNDKCQVLFFDSLSDKSFPEGLKKFLIEGDEITEITDTGKKCIKLLPFCTKEEIDFFDLKELTGQQMNGSDCGWWAVYYALMTIYTGGVEFLDPLKGKKLSAVPLRNIMNLQEASVIQQQSLQNRENHYKGSSVSAKSSLDQSSKEFIQSTEKGNLRVRLQNSVIDDIAKYSYKWTEDNNVIWGVEGPGRLPRELNKFKKNKDKTLIYIVNKDGNHWVTLVAIHNNRQGDIFFYADSFGEEIEKCLVNGLGRGDTDSNTQNKVSYGNKVNQYSVDRNSQNIEENSDDIIFVEETAPLKQDGNDNIRMSLDKFLEREGYSKNSIHSVSCKQQDDNYNCGVFALENAKAILNVVKGGDYNVAKVEESLKAVNKDIESLNILRNCFASSLTKVSPINKQSSVAFSSSSEKGIEESVEQEPLHNTENIPRENEQGITFQKKPGKKNFDDGKSYQKGVVSYEELEKQTLGKLKEISRKYILTDEEKEKKLSDFIERQEKGRRKFSELWEGFVSLSEEEKKKAILRIFFFAEFWDSSKDENEDALRNVVWNELYKLNAQDYIFRESVDYLISFASNPLVSIHMYTNNNRLQRVLCRAKSFLSNDEMGNLIIKICIEIFSMHNTFNRGEFIKSAKVIEQLSALSKFCEVGRRQDKIADLKLGNDQDCEIIYSLLEERSQLNIRSAISSLIEKIKLKETEEKENTLDINNSLEGFINDLCENKKDPGQIYQRNQIEGFLKQYDYYLITFAIDEVIQYNGSPLEQVLSIAQDYFSEEEMNAMLKRACKYIVDQRDKTVEGIAFDSEKAFRLLSDKLNSINRKKEEILKFLVDKLGKIQDFSENCQSSTLQQTLEEVVSYSPSRGKNTGNRNHESCSKNFFDELTMILDGGKTDKQDKIQPFISSRLSRYKGDCFYRLLLGEFLFENQDHAQISQKYLLLHLDSQSIAFLLTAGQREKAKTTVLSIIDKSRGPVPNISSFAIDYRNLQIVNLEIDPHKSHLLDGIKKEDIEQGYKIKFIPINEEVISFDLLRKAIKDVGSRKQVIDNLKNIVNFINYTFNLDNDKIKFSFIRDESDAKNLVDGLLMGSKHEIPSDDKIINEIISSLVKNNIQAKSNNIRDHRLPIADKRSGKKDKKKAEYYAYLSREYSIFSSQADVRGDRATFNRSAIRKNRKRPIINEENYGCNALHLAIANEKFDDVKKLVEANDGYVKGQDFYGNTPLHFAVQGKNLEILQFLMDYIGKQNHKEDYFVDKNCDGCTPLHFAARSGNIEVFSKLLKFVGAEAKEGYVKIKNNKGETPLHFAARSGKAEVVSNLLEFVDAKAKEGYVQSKDSKDETPLHFAARSGNVKVVEELLKFVNDNDKEGYVKHENSNKCTPLHFAAWGSNVEVINKLLEFVDKKERKGYVQSKNNKGETPLHFAAKKNNVGVILSLIGCVTEREGKENYVKCTNKLLYTPLHFAARSGNVKAVERLLEYVNDKEGYVRAENNEKETSLHFAARSGNVEVINKLLEFVGAEAKEGYVQSKNNKGETPLHFAARSSNVEVINKLLEFVGAEAKEGYVKIKNNKGETPLHFAARSGKAEVVSNLLEFVDAKAKEGYVQSKDSKDETPLHFAAKSGNVKVVEKLLQFVGENEKENYIEFANNDNKNALDIAISCDNCKVFYELLKYIKNPEQKQHYLDLVEKASDSKKRNIHSSDNLQTKGCVKKRKKQRNSEGLTSQYSKKRPRTVKSDSPRQEVKIKSKVVQNVSSDKSYEQQDSNRESGSEESCSRSSSPDSQEGDSYNKLGDNCCSINDIANSISMKLSGITKFMNKKDEYREISEKYYKRVDELKILESLRLACNSRSRDWDAIKLFIDKIDNVNKLLNDEGTLLHLAATDGQREMVKYLLEKGANVTFGSKGGSTPLHKAAQKGHLDIVRMLLERNAAVNAVDRCGRTALHLAAQEGHPDVVEMLLKKGARSFLDQYNNTPLQLISKRLSQDPENDRLKEVQGFLSNFIENSDESSSVLSSSGSQEVEHTASSDISEKSFGDEKSVCSSPEQNSGSSLEQASTEYLFARSRK